MLIGIDASRTNVQYQTGTETYSQKLIEHLALLDKDNQYVLYTNQPPKGGIKVGSNFCWKTMPFPKLWSVMRLSWEMVRKPPDLLFVPAHIIPLIHPRYSVVTVHDLGFIHFPKLYSTKEVLYHRWAMKFSVTHAKSIITVSQYSKEDLTKNYHLPKNKINVIYHGVDRDVFFPATQSPPLDIKNLQPYIFYLGRLEEKKNILGLLAAYRLLRKEQKIKHKLILTGQPGFGFEKIQAQINKYPSSIRKDIILTGYQEAEKTAQYLRYADIFFFPSFFEGFGMPVLEAMACGVPVVASNVTSLPEIVGKAGVLVDPNNTLEMAGALSKIVSKPELKKELIDKGLVRSKMFDWEKTAEKTLDVFHRVVL